MFIFYLYYFYYYCPYYFYYPFNPPHSNILPLSIIINFYNTNEYAATKISLNLGPFLSRYKIYHIYNNIQSIK